MRAVLMAGGAGTRLRPLTCDLPKPLLPVLNRPIAEHSLAWLRGHGLTELIMTLHYLPDTVQSYFQDGREFGVQVSYAVEELRPLGTAGCVRQVAALLTETFVVVSGDVITDVNLQAAIGFHRERGAKLTVILTQVADPGEFGVVITDGDGRVVRLLEKPTPGEVFSDRVNMGAYIVEPEVLAYLPPDQPADFAQDLLPQLLAQGEPVYGFVSGGYWCDVGNLERYRQVQWDALTGRVRLASEYRQVQTGLWLGEQVRLDPSVVWEPPVLIGHHCRIGAGVRLGAGTVIGDHVTVGAQADLKRPVILNGVMVGEESHLRGCVVGRGSRIGRRVQILEGAVLGHLCTVGEEAQVQSGCRIWPGKYIEPGATVTTNLIWGTGARRHLFGARGVSGLANVDVTPELAIRLGAAFGSCLSAGAQVQVSRDQRKVSRMLSRSIISGLMSVGVQVQNLEANAIPISRLVGRVLGVDGGVHVRLDPDQSGHVLIEFLDPQGINIPPVLEKKIEATLAREEFRRAALADIGDMTVPGRVADIYRGAFQQQLQVEAIRQSRAKVVVDYAYGVAGAVLPELLEGYGCDPLVLNASLRQTPLSLAEKESLLQQLGRVVEAVRAHLGVQVSANGERLVLVDETGTAMQGSLLTAVVMELILAGQPRGMVAVPVTTSSLVEQVARYHEGRVRRTKASATALMRVCQEEPRILCAGSGELGFIFPQLHPGFDAMFTIAKILELLTVQERSLAQIRAHLPTVVWKNQAVHCPWRLKGAWMRHLVETHPPDSLDLTDGVRIFPQGYDPDHWVLFLPDATEPMVHLVVNGLTREWVNHWGQEYRQRLQNFMEQQEV